MPIEGLIHQRTLCVQVVNAALGPFPQQCSPQTSSHIPVFIAVPVPHALPMLEDTFHPIPSGVMPRHRHGCSGKAGRGGVTGFKGRTAGFHNLGVTLDLVSPICVVA